MYVEETCLLLGHSIKDNKNIYLSPMAKKKHLALYGEPLRGREDVLINLAKKEALRSENGATFIVTSSFLAGAIYNILKSNTVGKREIVWLSPSLHLGVKNQLMWMDEYEEEALNKYVIDYTKMLKKGSFVIIDLNPLFYLERSYKAQSILMKHLRNSLVRLSPSEHKEHAIYVEDAKTCVDDLIFFIEHGQRYNCGVVYCMESPKLWGRHFAVVDAMVHNVVLFNRFHLEDSDYFLKLFLISDAKSLFHRKPQDALYSLIGDDYCKYQGLVRFLSLSEYELNKIIVNGKRSKTGHIREFVVEDAKNNDRLNGENSYINDGQDWVQTLLKLTKDSEGVVPLHQNYNEY